MLLAEAGIVARDAMPEVAELTFRLVAGDNGPSASLIAAHAANGRRLWHVDDGEWPDESLITDYLVAAETWCDGYFSPTDDSGQLVVLDLDDQERRPVSSWATQRPSVSPRTRGPNRAPTDRLGPARA